MSLSTAKVLSRLNVFTYMNYGGPLWDQPESYLAMGRLQERYISRSRKEGRGKPEAGSNRPASQPLPVWLASGHCSSHSGPPTEQPFGASIFPWKREKSQNGCPRRRQPFLLQRADSLTPRPPVPTRFVSHQLCHSQIGCTVGDTSVL